MKNKKRTIIVFLAFLMVPVYFAWTMDGFTQSRGSSAVVLKGTPSKAKLVLGEPLTVDFNASNTGQDLAKVGVGGVNTGGLKIYIAYNNGAYNEYFGWGWGRKRGSYATVEPGKFIELDSVPILWNGKPNVSHLNEVAAKEYLAGKITTDYAFDAPGIYHLKGRAYTGETGTPVDSAPLRLEVFEPVGGDLEVWNQIKGNSQIALLMQNGDFSVDDEQTRQQLASEVEKIIAAHPNSVYTPYLQTNLNKFRKTDAKRKEFHRMQSRPGS